ncbi:MAG: ABC transporter permease [Gallicola sp.]|nr:ABC transporter permease [Gallicola sp.]
MKKFILLLKRSLKKGRGQSVSFFLVMLTTAILLNLALITINNFEKGFDQTFSKLNSPDIALGMLGRDDSKLKSFVEEDPRSKEYEATPMLALNGRFDYNDNETSIYAGFLNRSEDWKIGKTRVVKELSKEKLDKISEDKPAIYISNLFHTGGGYNLGDVFVFKTEKKDYSFTIAGFTENIFLGVTNMMFSGFELNDEDYQRLEKELGPEAEGLWSKAKVHSSVDVSVYLEDAFHSIDENKHLVFSVQDREVVKHFRIVTASIVSTILLVFSIIILAVGLVVVRFRIQNSIEEDQRNIGVLKAIGYSSFQMITSYVVIFGFLAVFAVLIGIAISYGVLPILAGMYSIQTGIEWSQGFDPYSSILTVVILMAAVCISAWVSSQAAGRIEAITALRSGVNTHSFKKNYFPLKKHKRHLHFVLSLKNMMGRMRQNLLILIICAAVSFATMFSLVMYYNIHIEDEKFMNMVGGEVPDMMLIAKDTKDTDFYLEEAAKFTGVKESVLFDNFKVDVLGTTGYMDTTPDFSKIQNRGLYKGRSPKYNNEVAVCPILLEGTGKDIGDSITLTYEGKSADYIITGFVQSSNNMGKDLQMTLDGAKRFNPDFAIHKIYLYCDESADVAGILEDIQSKHPGAFQSATNVREVAENNVAVYLQIVAIMVTVIVLVTFGIIALVLYLVIKTIITKNGQNFGILKAVGFTGGELILQTAMSYQPVIFLGTVVGAVFGAIGMNPMIALLFNGLGVVRSDFYVFPWMALVVIVIISLFSFLISIAVSSRIRKIMTVDYLTA